MDKRAIITGIQIISNEKTDVLNRIQIKKFCKEKIQISILESVNSSSHKNEPIRSCRVVLNKMSVDYIRNALYGDKIIKNDQQYKDKAISKVN